MKNKKVKTILLACSLLLTTVLSGCGEASSTVSIAEKANLAYQDILKAAPAIDGEYEQLSDASFDYDQNLELFGNHYDLFEIIDINRDEIPELIALTTINFRWNLVSVYTFADGEAVLLKDQTNLDSHGSFEQKSTANGAYDIYICEENHIHSVWRGSNPMGEAVEENYAYAIEGTTLTTVDCASKESEKTINYYDIANVNTIENVDKMLNAEFK